MKKILLIACTILILPLHSPAQTDKSKAVLVLPFVKLENGKSTGYNDFLSNFIGRELERTSDYKHRFLPNFFKQIGKRNLPAAHLARLAKRQGYQGVIWGSLDKSDKGYTLKVRFVTNDPRKKEKRYTITAENSDQMIKGLQNTVRQIGSGESINPKIGKITITGNKKIGRDAILNKINVKPGVPFNEAVISEDIRDIYSMGYFDDIRVRADKGSNGDVNLEIVLKERPHLQSIEIKGNSLYTQDQILDRLHTRPYKVANTEWIAQDIEQIKRMYEKEGYFQPKIEYEIKELSRNESKLVLKIDEGRKSYLTELEFDGAKKISPKELRKAMKVLLKEKSWFWFLDQTGQFTREQMEQGRQLLMQHYMDKGFISVQVGAPRMKIDGKKIKITYPIREGDRYQIRSVDVTGDLKMEKDKLLARLKTKPQKWFKRSNIAEDLKALTKLYNDLGYANVDVQPLQKVNQKEKSLSMTYHIVKGKPVTVARVSIQGNERTRDKVIRRHLGISDGDLYNASAIEGSKKNLESMGFFETVKVKTELQPGLETMDVIVDVDEKKTGQLSAGLGLSSQEGAMANVSLQEKNLMGLGISANLKADISGRRNTYEGSLSYPWLFDIPLTTSVRAYNTVTQESYYVRKSDGFSLSGAYPIFGRWQASVGFSRDGNKLSGFRPFYGRSVQEYYAKYGVTASNYVNTSENAVSMVLSRDVRSGGVIPTNGTKLIIGSRLSGLGADVYYQRYYGEAAYYRPLFWKALMKVQTNVSLLAEWEDQPIPFDKRILLGGPNTIRGYQYGQIGPIDRYGAIIGGDRALYATAECLFPIVESLNLNGVFFFDVGNAWNAEETPFPEEVKAGGGLGLRWLSPMGPIRIEYGWKVAPQKGETPGEFSFSMGRLF